MILLMGSPHLGKGPSVNIDIYLETKTSRLGGRGSSACSFLEKISMYILHAWACPEKKTKKYRYYVPFVCVRFSGRGAEEKRLVFVSK